MTAKREASRFVTMLRWGLWLFFRALVTLVLLTLTGLAVCFYLTPDADPRAARATGRAVGAWLRAAGEGFPFDWRFYLLLATVSGVALLSAPVARGCVALALWITRLVGRGRAWRHQRAPQP